MCMNRRQQLQLHACVGLNATCRAKSLSSQASSYIALSVWMYWLDDQRAFQTSARFYPLIIHVKPKSPFPFGAVRQPPNRHSTCFFRYETYSPLIRSTSISSHSGRISMAFAVPLTAPAQCLSRCVPDSPQGIQVRKIRRQRFFAIHMRSARQTFAMASRGKVFSPSPAADAACTAHRPPRQPMLQSSGKMSGTTNNTYFHENFPP